MTVLLAAYLVLQAPSAAPPPSSVTEDIVVIGQRVRKVKFRIKLDKAGRTVCRITRSSGDPEIDSFACDAARPCVRPDSVTKAAMEACLGPRWSQLPAQIAARRRIASERGGHAPD